MRAGAAISLGSSGNDLRRPLLDLLMSLLVREAIAAEQQRRQAGAYTAKYVYRLGFDGFWNVISMHVILSVFIIVQ